MLKKSLTTITAGALLAGFSASAVVVYEGFDYADGSILTGSGGDNWDGAWSTDSDSTGDPSEFYTSTPGLSISGLTTTGGLASRSEGTFNRGWATRSIGGTTQSSLTGGSEMWFSFLYNSSGGEDFAFVFGDYDGLEGGTNPTLTSAGDAFGFASNGQNFSTITFDNSTGQTLGTTSAGGTSTVFIVGKITFDDMNEGGFDKLELFNLSNATTPEGSLPAAFSTATADLTQSGFDTVGLWDRPNSVGQIDEIRLGNSYADVSAVPEPSAFALLAGVFGLACVMLRRRS